MKYNDFLIDIFIYTFFGTGQTRRQIFTFDSSNDADSRKGMHFWGFVYIVPHFGGEIPLLTPKFFGA